MPKCSSCGTTFEVDTELTGRFPGWTPKECSACWKNGRKGSGGGRTRGGSRGGGGGGRRGTLTEENLTTAEVLAKYTDGPTEGVFTDGSSSPNPGPGGWGAVYVVDGEVVDRAHGHDPATTNNRMELAALKAGIELVPEGTPAVLYTDSRLAVDTLTKWAKGWEAKGWKRKGGEIKNLDLIKPLYRLVSERPEVEIRWIAAHSGNRWNEYADSLSTAWLRDEV